MKYFPRVRRPSHHQVWGIFADIDTIAKHVDVPTVEIITSFLANPDKAVKLNAAAYSRTVAVNAGHRQRSMWQRDIPLLADHASDGSPLAVTAYGLTEHELINRAPEAYKPDRHFGIYDEDAELTREMQALTKRYEREGVNLHPPGSSKQPLGVHHPTPPTPRPHHPLPGSRQRPDRKKHTMSPKRIQRQRTRGWKAPAGAVYVGRGSIYGNPWKVDPAAAPQPGIVATHEEAVALFTKWLRSTPDGQAVARPARKHLAGHDLMCWCPNNKPCHADVLLTVANPQAARPAVHVVNAVRREDADYTAFFVTEASIEELAEKYYQSFTLNRDQHGYYLSLGHNTGLVARPGTVIVEGPHGWGDWEVMTMDEYDAQYETVGGVQ